MNTTLTTTRGRHEHPPHVASTPVETTHLARRVGILDRAALHIGLALITWGRRPIVAAESRERRASRHEQHVARIARERAAELTLRLTVPLR